MEEGLAISNNVDCMDLKILSRLHMNSRETLTNIGRETGIPISSIFDRLKRLDRTGIIKRYTILFDWKKIGINTRVVLLLKTRDNMKHTMECWLKEHKHVNSLFWVNGDWNFMAEALFQDIKTLEKFIESLRESFQGIEISVQYVLKELKREGFSPDLGGSL